MRTNKTKQNVSMKKIQVISLTVLFHLQQVHTEQPPLPVIQKIIRLIIHTDGLAQCITAPTHIRELLAVFKSLKIL